MIASQTMLRPGVWAATWGHDDGDEDNGDDDDSDDDEEDNGKMAAAVVGCHLVEELFRFLSRFPQLAPLKHTASLPEVSDDLRRDTTQDEPLRF